MDFSVIIPAKNEAKYIGMCLDSLNMMDATDITFEIIVVDNGSTDKTVEIAKAKGATVYEKPELTISALRNYGAAMAVGNILAFLDSDCTVDSRWLKNALIYENKDKIISFGSPAILPENSTWVQRSWFAIRAKKSTVEEVEWLESANVFVQRRAFLAVGGFDETLITCEDYDLSARLKVMGQLLCDNRIVAIHHREPATIGEFFRKEKWRGKSNFAGIIRHGIRLKEMPSLILPLLQCLFAISLIFCVILYMFNGAEYMYYAAIILIVWQLPIICLACFKSRTTNIISIIQLHLLLNVYFTARGLAIYRI